MLVKLKYKTRLGKELEGVFDKVGSHYHQMITDTASTLDKANQIVSEIPLEESTNGTKDLRYGRNNNEFGDWMRLNLPSSQTGLCIADFDWLYYNWKTKKFQLVEEKRAKGYVNEWIKRFRKEVLHPAMEEFCKKNGIKYGGYNIVHFEKNGPTDGKIFFGENLGEEVEITEQELRDKLGMEHL